MMFGRKVMTVDMAKNREMNRLFRVMSHGWVPCDFEQIGRQTRHHDRVRVTLRRRRFGEEKFKMGVVNSLYMWKIPKKKTDE